jgi:hypothetical protein
MVAGRLSVEVEGWVSSLSSSAEVSPVDADSSAEVPETRPALLEGPKRCPPPSPSNEGFLILVRADRRRMEPGAGTINGESASDEVVSTSRDQLEYSKWR